MTPKRPTPRWMKVSLIISGVASAIALASMIGITVSMVSSGRGLESYRTFWLVEDNWLGFLVFVGCLLVAVAVGLFQRWRERRD